MAFTYPELGRTRERELPAGYRHVRRHAVVGAGGVVFAGLRQGMCDFQIHRLAGMRVRGAASAAPGARFDTGLGAGPFRLWVPCQIVWYEDSPLLYGYGFGTLPGHPERGEEAFLTRLDGDGRVHFEIRAFSRPATWYARLGGPLTTRAQDLATDRYLRSAHRLSAGHGQAPGR